MSSVIVVKAAFDEEAAVWYVESSDVKGLHLEGETLQALVGKIPAALEDLLDDQQRGQDIPVEVVAHARTRVLAAA